MDAIKALGDHNLVYLGQALLMLAVGLSVPIALRLLHRDWGIQVSAGVTLVIVSLFVLGIAVLENNPDHRRIVSLAAQVFVVLVLIGVAQGPGRFGKHRKK